MSKTIAVHLRYKSLYISLASSKQQREMTKLSKARFKRRILHAPNRIAELSACKMRRLNQLNATYCNSMRVQSNIRLKFDS